jgi:hypothetical protein
VSTVLLLVLHQRTVSPCKVPSLSTNREVLAVRALRLNWGDTGPLKSGQWQTCMGRHASVVEGRMHCHRSVTSGGEV